MAVLRKGHHPPSFAQRVLSCCVLYQIRHDLPGGVNERRAPVAPTAKRADHRQTDRQPDTVDKHAAKRKTFGHATRNPTLLTAHREA
eukprot:1797164-Pyramimonas_sp.AAC.1